MSFREQLADALEQAFNRAKQQDLVGNANLPEITIERPAKPDHGDYASSLPLKLARLTGLKPVDIANAIVKNIPPVQYIGEVQVAAPGFINFTVSNEWLTRQVDIICDMG